MSDQLPALLVVLPLLAACLAAMAWWLRPSLCFPLALVGLIGAVFSSLGMLHQVLTGPDLLYRLGGWDPPMGIVYAVDKLNGTVLAVVSVSALLGLIGSRTNIEAEQHGKAGIFYALYLLTVAGLLGIVVTGDAFNLYVLLEIAALSGYALIAMGDERAPLASLNYLFIGTIGATFYLLGVGILYIQTGTLNMADLALRLKPLYGSTSLLVAFLVIGVGLGMKMAFFPVHGWLPGAYTHAPSAATILMAPLTTKVMIYVLIRMVLTVFTPDYVFGTLDLSGLMVWLASAAIVAGAIMALAQKDFKRMLTYVVVAEVGYMVGGTWLGNRDGMTGAVLHLVNDVMMTLTVFLAVSALIQRTGGRSISGLQGMFGRMPWTMAAFAAAGLAIIGVPPFCGFFSKWYLLLGAVQAGQWQFVVALILASLVSAVLFFRLFEVALFDSNGSTNGAAHGSTGHHGQAVGHGQSHSGMEMAEAPLSLLIPLLLTAVSLVALGLLTRPIVVNLILPILPEGLS